MVDFDFDRTDWPEPTAGMRSIADLAHLALAAIEQQLAVDPGDEPAIGRIISTVFGRIDTYAGFAQAPDRTIEALVADPGELHRIAEAVHEIVSAAKKVAAR